MQVRRAFGVVVLAGPLQREIFLQVLQRAAGSHQRRVCPAFVVHQRMEQMHRPHGRRPAFAGQHAGGVEHTFHRSGEFGHGFKVSTYKHTEVTEKTISSLGVSQLTPKMFEAAASRSKQNAKITLPPKPQQTTPTAA